MLRDECGGLVARREERPAVEAVLAAEAEQEARAFDEGKRPLREAREAGQPVVAVPQHPRGNPAASETAHDTERAIVGADDERAGRHGRAAAATARAAKPVPATNRISGPKLHAAGAPTKCRPGIDD